MFHSARIKLTAWYLLIIMTISILFSLAIYGEINREFVRIDRFQKIRQQEREGLIPTLEQILRDRESLGQPTPTIPRNFSAADPEIIEEARGRVIASLVLVNLGILGFAALSGYFLAGRTLKPIATMVDEQNRFIADASHELRTPLTSLKSEIEVSLRDKKLTADEMRSLLASNLEDVNSLQDLSDNLIKLTQYQKVNGDLKFEKVNINLIIEDAVKKVSFLAKTKNINIGTDLGNYKLAADRQSLTEMFVIFLDNAIKYSPKGKSIKIKAKKEDSHIMVSIQDQGVGINKDDIPHLFERFYRGDKSRTKTNVAGYGLGLSIAKQIADKHGATISIESKNQSGTLINLRLPQNH